MNNYNWKPSADTLELLEELRESVNYWQDEIEKHERFRGEDMDIDKNIRNIKDKLTFLKYMQFMVRRNAYP